MKLESIYRWLLLCKNVRNAIFYGICAAFLVLFCGFFPFNFSIFFAGLPLFFSYLSCGKYDGALSSLVTFIIVVVFCKNEIVLNVSLNVIFPAVVLGQCSIKSIVNGKKTWWYPESFLLNHLVFISILSLIVMSLTFYNENKILSLYDETMKILFKDNTSPEVAIICKQFQKFIKYSVGIGIFSKMLITISNLQIASIISKRLKMNIRPQFDTTNITVPYWLSIISIIFLTVASIAPGLSFIFSGLSVVGLFAPMISGLSLIHFYAQKMKREKILISLYIVLFIFPLPVIFFAIAFGIIDSFYPMRQLISKEK